MEEILASIRRIISEDELGLGSSEPSLPKVPDPAPLPSTLPSVPVSAADIDALFSARVAEFAAPQPAPELRVELPRVEPEPAPAPLAEPRMLRPVPPTPVASVPVRAPEPVRAAESPRAATPARVETPAPVRHVAPPADELPAGAPLLSPAADAIVNSAFGSLASTVLAGNARTLEDLVKDMLRPMLKSWLDTNLPPLVERLVRDEIERVSRGR